MLAHFFFWFWIFFFQERAPAATQKKKKMEQQNIFVTDSDRPVLAKTECKIIVSSYMNMLLHTSLLETSNIDNIAQMQEASTAAAREASEKYREFINPEAELWCDDPIIDKAFEDVTINLYNGKGKGTQFCYNPEVIAFVYGNEDIYNVYKSKKIYGDEYLTFQPSGFIVFPSSTYASFINVHYDFMNYVNIERLANEKKKPRSYFGYVVVCSDFASSEEAYRCPHFKTTHYIEYLENIEEHMVLLKIFFSVEYGHPSHKMSFSVQELKVQLQKKFDVVNYNSFLHLYRDYVQNPKRYEKHVREGAVDHCYCKMLLDLYGARLVVPETDLLWKKNYLYEGSFVVINDNIPHRFGCHRPPNIFNQKFGYAPLIMVELNVFPIAFFSDDELKGNMISINNFTLSPVPYHNTNFTKKVSNRFENFVVKLMMSISDNGRYESPFVLNGDYFTPLPDPLHWAYRGFQSCLKPFTWEEYKKIKETQQ